MSRHVFAKTTSPAVGGYYPPYINLTETGPMEVTVHVRAPEKELGSSGTEWTFVLTTKELIEMSFALNQVIARATSNA